MMVSHPVCSMRVQFFCSGVSQLKIAVTVEIQLSNLLDSHVISLFQLTVGGTLFDHKRIHKGAYFKTYLA